jgi:hypothetical protein
MSIKDKIRDAANVVKKVSAERETCTAEIRQIQLKHEVDVLIDNIPFKIAEAAKFGENSCNIMTLDSTDFVLEGKEVILKNELAQAFLNALREEDLDVFVEYKTYPNMEDAILGYNMWMCCIKLRF